MPDFYEEIEAAFGCPIDDFPKDPREFEKSFLDDIWQMIPKSVRENHRTIGRSIGKTLSNFFSAPRVEQIVFDFQKYQIDRLEPETRLLIYPCNQIGKRLANHIRTNTQCKIIGFIDRDVSLSTEEASVYSPETAITLLQDPDVTVLIAHPVHELMFRQKLVGAGFPSDRISAVYTHSEFASWYKAHSCTPPILTEEIPDQIKYLVISTYSLAVLDAAALNQLCPSEETLYVQLGDTVISDADRPHQVNIPISSKALKKMIDRVQPDAIYLSTFHADHFWYLVVNELASEIPIIHEIYDIITHFPNYDVYERHSSCDELLAASRLAEYVATKHAAAFVTKRSGPVWQKTLNTFEAPYYRFCQSLTDIEQISDNDMRRTGTEHLKLVYAGPIPAPDMSVGLFPCYQFMELLYAMPDVSGIRLDTFNSFHRDQKDDTRFDLCIRKLSRNGSLYHRAIPYLELIKTMRRYDYGWMCLNREQDMIDYPDTRTVISARVSGYISAGLPIIIDSTWDATVELIEKFNAGIVIDEPTPEKIQRILSKKPDTEMHRLGARKMRQYLLDSNDKTLESIRKLISTFSA